MVAGLRGASVAGARGLRSDEVRRLHENFGRNQLQIAMPSFMALYKEQLLTPIAIEKQLRFAIREGGRTVGAGVVSEIIE